MLICSVLVTVWVSNMYLSVTVVSAVMNFAFRKGIDGKQAANDQANQLPMLTELKVSSEVLRSEGHSRAVLCMQFIDVEA
eukprot:2561174-Amphidinium_carterae.1